MKTSKEAFDQFIREYGKLEVQMNAAVLAALAATGKTHVGAYGGFKPFQRSLLLLQQCATHIGEYSKEQIEQLAAFAKRLNFYGYHTKKLDDAFEVGGYLAYKEFYYRRIEKTDLKTPARKAQLSDMQRFFSTAASRLTPIAGESEAATITPSALVR